MGNRYAVLIGNYRYKDKRIPPLNAPQADVEELYAILTNPAIGGFPERNVKWVFNPSAAKAQGLIEQLFKEKRRDDLVLLYFSGHADIDISGDLYLYVSNTNPSLLESTSISAAFIKKLMDHPETYPERQVVILDCCYAGQFATGLKAASVIGAKVDHKTIFLEGSERGKVVMAATGGRQLAWENDVLSGDKTQSVYTHYLVEGIRTGAADTTGRGWISVKDIHKYTRDCVLEHLASHPKKTMTPVLHHIDQSDDLMLALNPNSALEVVVARLQQKRVVASSTSCLFPPSQQNDAIPLFTACGEETTMILITGKEVDANKNYSNHIVFSAEIQVFQQPFYLSCHRGKNNSLEVSFDGAELLREIPFSHDVPQFDLEVAETTIQVVFILDVTMEREELKFGLKLIDSIMKSTEQLGGDIRFGCVCYGEYGDHLQRRNRRASRKVAKSPSYFFDFESELIEPTSPNLLRNHVEGVKQKVLTQDFKQQDFCDALELAMSIAVKQIDWSAEYNQVVVIGNSPPHPTIDEYDRFHFFDYTTDEFANIDWRTELKKLRGMGVNSTSFWVQSSSAAVVDLYAEYIDEVWSALDDGGRYLRINDESSIESASSEFLSRLSSKVPICVAEIIGIPLMK